MNLYFLPSDNGLTKGLLEAVQNLRGHTVTDELGKAVDALVLDNKTEKTHPDVVKAIETGVPVWSIAKTVYELSVDKQRVLVAGTIGRNEIMSCVMHVLNTVGRKFDHVLGDTIKLTDAPLLIIDGSADVSLLFDNEAQFDQYNHHIVLISQLQHELEQIYPSFDAYVKEFDRLADATPKGGSVIYCEDDDLVTVIGGKERPDNRNIPYTKLNGDINIGAAHTLLKRFSVTDEQFDDAIKSFNH